MSRPSSSRPAFPFFGAALLLAIAAAISALSFGSYLPAVFCTTLGLISLSLGMPTPEPIRVHARSSRD